MPRFGLRFLFAFLIVASLVVGWIARNVHRVRQEDAAIEALSRAGAKIEFEYEGGDVLGWPGTGFDLPGLAQRVLGLADRPAVRSVRLTADEEDAESPVVAPALAALGTFEEIETLRLDGLAIDDPGIASLARLPNLETLYLERTNVTAAGLTRIAPHVPLGRLIAFVDDPASDLATALPRFERLRTLTLIGAPVSQDDLDAIGGMTQLESLTLMHLQPYGDDPTLPTFDADLGWLAGLGDGGPELDLSSLGRLTKLEVLKLTNLDDEDLTSLGRMPSLREFEAFGVVTMDGLRAFSVENPECFIRSPEVLDSATGLRAGEKIWQPAD